MKKKTFRKKSQLSPGVIVLLCIVLVVISRFGKSEQTSSMPMPSPSATNTQNMKLTLESVFKRIATQTALPITGCSNGYNVNVRSGPGTDYEVVGRIAASECVTLQGRNQDTSWVLVNAQNTSGWVLASLLAVKGNSSTLSIKSGISLFPATRTPNAPVINNPQSNNEVNCSAAYPGVCIPPPPPDLDCGDISFRRFTVLPSDPHNFDADGDGIGCEN